MKDTAKRPRETKQRRLVYDAVMRRCDHPSADDIYLELHAKDRKISKGTIYRNLNLLSEREEISHVRVPGSDRYDRRTDAHYHLLCTVCGKVADVPIPYNAENDAFVAESTGFLIDRHETVFEGICPECQKRREKSAAQTGNEDRTSEKESFEK